MTGRGGWPLNAFTTPEQVPFYAGTYFPPETRHGMPSWMMVLEAVAKAWDERREEIRAGGGRIVERLQGAAALPGVVRAHRAAGAGRRRRVPAHRIRPDLRRLWRRPQFPPSSAIEFLLGRGETEMSLGTLRAMAAGGIHDQVGGGFSRYAVDATWTVRTSRRCSTTTRCSRGLPAPLPGLRRRRAPRVRAATARLGPCARCGARGRLLLGARRGPEASRAATTLDAGRLRDTLGTWRDDAIAWFGATERGNFEGANVLEAHGPVPRPATRSARACTRRESGACGRASTTSAWPRGTR